MSVDAAARKGWSGRGAQDYEAGRPDYPPALAELLGSELGLGPGRRILDLAAGTGKLTRRLLDTGAEIVAVEPLAAMRDQLVAAVTGVAALDGTAEAIPLADGDVDAVTVAQAFHWFDVPAAAAEIARVLRAGGRLVVVRNTWDESVAWVAALRGFLAERIRSPSGHRSWVAELDATERFEPFAERTLVNPQRSDLAGLRLRVASMSHVAGLPDTEREALLDDLQALLEAHGLRAGEPIEVPTETVVRWAARRESA